MSVEIQGTPQTPGSSAAVEETATVSVEAEGVVSTGNGKKRVGCSCFLFINAFIQIVIGGYFHHDCPAQPYIPIYLEVLGAVTMVFYVWCEDRPILIQLFCFCFIITGGVWIYSIFPPSYNSDIMPYCNKTLYLFAFIETTIIFVLGGLNILCCCCCTV